MTDELYTIIEDILCQWAYDNIDTKVAKMRLKRHGFSVDFRTGRGSLVEVCHEETGNYYIIAV